jgi:hypothetical protein
MCGSRGITGAVWWTANRPEAPRCEESIGSCITTAQMLGQSSADQRYSPATPPLPAARLWFGVHGLATISRPATGPAKIRSPSLSPRFGPHVKQFGKRCRLNPGYARLAASLSSNVTVGGDPNVHSGRSHLDQQVRTIQERGLLTVQLLNPQTTPQRNRSTKDRLRPRESARPEPPDVASKSDLRDALESRIDNDSATRRHSRSFA